MVLKESYKPKWIERRPYIALVIGFIGTIISFIMSILFFSTIMSVAVVFLTTLILIPLLAFLISKEEERERREGLRHFFMNHKDIFEAYIFAFIGVFLAFVLLGITLGQDDGNYTKVFTFQQSFLDFKQDISPLDIEEYKTEGIAISSGDLFNILTHDLGVLLICFILSFLYGATAIFLIILNGSVFASFIVYVIKTMTESIVQGLQALLIFMIHLIPEVSGYLLAAIAGGVVSKALIKERKESSAFKNVFKDATMLMIIAVLFVILGAFLEVSVSAKLFKMLI